MISVRIRHWLLLATALGLLLVVLSTSGCRKIVKSSVEQTTSLFRLNTMVKQYLAAPDDEPPVDSVGGYEISLHIQAVKPQDREGIDSFRVSVDSRYYEKVKSKQLLRTPALRLDSLSIRPYRLVVSGNPDDVANRPGLKLSMPLTGFYVLLTPEDSIYRPALVATDQDKRRLNPEMFKGRLVGPSYRYDLVDLPDRYVGIEMSYVARLVDRASDSEIERVEITRGLHRVHELRYY